MKNTDNNVQNRALQFELLLLVQMFLATEIPSHDFAARNDGTTNISWKPLVISMKSHSFGIITGARGDLFQLQFSNQFYELLLVLS